VKLDKLEIEKEGIKDRLEETVQEKKVNSTRVRDFFESGEIHLNQIPQST